MNEDRPIGVVPIGNTIAIEVMDIEYGIEDRVVYRFTDDYIVRKAKIHTNTSRAFIRTPIGRVRLEEVIKV